MLQQEKRVADSPFFHQMNNGLLKFQAGSVVHATEIHDVNNAKHSPILLYSSICFREGRPSSRPCAPHPSYPACSLRDLSQTSSGIGSNRNKQFHCDSRGWPPHRRSSHSSCRRDQWAWRTSRTLDSCNSSEDFRGALNPA